ncbi:MAG: hypothetical protein ACLFTG_11665, partial [Alphaproteobacteria bacterium]
ASAETSRSDAVAVRTVAVVKGDRVDAPAHPAPRPGGEGVVARPRPDPHFRRGPFVALDDTPSHAKCAGAFERSSRDNAPKISPFILRSSKKFALLSIRFGRAAVGIGDAAKAAGWFGDAAANGPALQTLTKRKIDDGHGFDAEHRDASARARGRRA